MKEPIKIIQEGLEAYEFYRANNPNLKLPEPTFLEEERIKDMPEFLQRMLCYLTDSTQKTKNLLLARNILKSPQMERFLESLLDREEGTTGATQDEIENFLKFLKSKNNQKPMELNEILFYSLVVNRGNIVGSFNYCAKLLENITRNPEVVEQKIPYKEQANLIEDNLSPFVPTKNLPNEEPKIREQILYDFSLPNRLGQNYHFFSLLGLLGEYSPECIRLFCMGEYLEHFSKQGMLKALSDARVLKDMYKIKNLLRGYKPKK